MANHVTKQEREALRAAALEYTRLGPDGHIMEFDATVAQLAEQQGVSLQRARSAVAYAARRQRSPDYDPPAPGRPVVMDDGQPVTVYLPQWMIDRASRLGGGNLSEGMRTALASLWR